jgi:co-chaperonin GroES (HSP10)
MNILKEKNKMIDASEFNKQTRIPSINPDALKKELEKAKEEASDTSKEFKVIGNGVVIAFTAETVTESGVILTKDADQSAEDPQLVLSVGPMVKDIKRGDMVILKLSARPETFKYERKKYLMFREHDVLCVVDK